ncbi:MAG: diacylglycerol kinase [Holosporales bacterium]|jgi:diacylglycerol kinase (ATP)|nr:diacylglycerol kinase [Holosporales bacterium]
MKSILAIKYAFLYSIDGLRILLKERAFRQELILGFILGIIEYLFGDKPTLVLLYLLGSYFLVLITECINSAIEIVVDRISIEQHPLSKKAKDLGSLAVLISLIHLGIAWTISWFI